MEKYNHNGYPSRQGGKSRMQEEFTRARFEEWYKKTYWAFTDAGAGYDPKYNKYTNLTIQLAWAAYQQGIRILKVQPEATASVEQVEKDATVQAECDSLKKKLVDTEFALRYTRGSLDSAKMEATGWKTRARYLQAIVDEVSGTLGRA